MNLEQVTELLPSAVIQIADLIGFPATEQLLSLLVAPRSR